MEDPRENAAEAIDDLAGAIWRRQLEIIEETLQERIEKEFDSTEEVNRNIHQFYDLEDIPEEYKDLEQIRTRLDGAYESIKGTTPGGDHDFVEDITPTVEASRAFLEKLQAIDTSALLERDQEAIDALDDALDTLQKRDT